MCWLLCNLLCVLADQTDSPMKKDRDDWLWIIVAVRGCLSTIWPTMSGEMIPYLWRVRLLYNSRFSSLSGFRVMICSVDISKPGTSECDCITFYLEFVRKPECIHHVSSRSLFSYCQSSCSLMFSVIIERFIWTGTSWAIHERQVVARIFHSVGRQQAEGQSHIGMQYVKACVMGVFCREAVCWTEWEGVDPVKASMKQFRSLSARKLPNGTRGCRESALFLAARLDGSWPLFSQLTCNLVLK